MSVAWQSSVDDSVADKDSHFTLAMVVKSTYLRAF